MRFPRSGFAQSLVRWFADYTVTDNGEGLLLSPECYKILASDDEDDVFDSFSQIPMAVALRVASTNYNSREWQDFYKSLVLILDTEKELEE